MTRSTSDWLSAVAASFIFAALASSAINADEVVSANEPTIRTNSGLLAFYDFSSTSGRIVKDLAGVGQPVDLTIENPGDVRRAAGSLEVIGDTQIRSNKPPRRMIEAIRRSGEITVEAWLQPANTKQQGPARIVTLSRNGSNRNVTLGQEGDRYDVRLRTTSTNSNGLPSISSPKESLQTKLTHVVYTRNRKGQAKLFLNGQRESQDDVSGSTSNWDNNYQLALANEFGGSRQWRGTYYLVAIYKRDLSRSEIQQNYQAGPDAKAPDLVVATRDVKAEHFQTKIAPLLCIIALNATTRRRRKVDSIFHASWRRYQVAIAGLRSSLASRQTV